MSSSLSASWVAAGVKVRLVSRVYGSLLRACSTFHCTHHVVTVQYGDNWVQGGGTDGLLDRSIYIVDVDVGEIRGN